MIWMFVGFTVLMLGLVALDRPALQLRTRAPTRREALRRAVFWSGLTVIASAAVFSAYHEHWMGLGLDRDGTTRLTGYDAAIEFLIVFAIELALSLDTVFIFSAIFTRLEVPRALQLRLLTVGIPLAVLLSGATLAVAYWALRVWPVYTAPALGVLLILAAIRMIMMRRETPDPAGNLFVRLATKLYPIAASRAGSGLFTRVDGKRAITPLFVALLVIETADVAFSADAITGSLAITQEPLLIFAASCLSLPVSRSLYFALTLLSGWLRYVKVGLVLTLAYLAVLMFLPPGLRPDTEVTLSAVAISVLVGLFLAVRLGKPGPAPAVSPLGADAEELARLTLKQARRIIVFVVGVTVLCLAPLVGFLPGPGGVFVFIGGLMILSTEFLWARDVLGRVERSGRKVADAAGRFTDRLLGTRRWRFWRKHPAEPKPSSGAAHSSDEPPLSKAG